MMDQAKNLSKQIDWEYRVIPKDVLLSEIQNHDIAVSQKDSTARKENSKINLEKSLNNLGSDGWEFITVLGEFGIFKKPKKEF